jgi:hypothetical protein
MATHTATGVVGQGDAGFGEGAGEAVGEGSGGDVVEVDAAAGHGGGHDHGGRLDPVPGHREITSADPVAATDVQALLIEMHEDTPVGEEAGGLGDLRLDRRGGDQAGAVGAGGKQHRRHRGPQARPVRGVHVRGERSDATGPAQSADAGVARDDLGAGGLHRREMPVDQPRTERVTAGIGEGDLPGAGQHRGGQHGGRPDLAAELGMDDRADVARQGQREAAVAVGDFGPGVAQDLRAHPGVDDVRRPGQGDRDVGQERGRVQVQGDVLAPLHRDPAGQRAPTSDLYEAGVHRGAAGGGDRHGWPSPHPGAGGKEAADVVARVDHRAGPDQRAGRQDGSGGQRDLVADDRARQLAEVGGEALAVAESARQLAVLARKAGWHQEALSIALTAADHPDLRSAGRAGAAVRGLLVQSASYTLARRGDRDGMRELTDEAAAIAKELGGATLLRDHGGGFSPLTVQLHKISAENHAGDPLAALAAARTISLKALPSVERRSRALGDIAVTYDRLGRRSDCVRTLLAAERCAPEETHARPATKSLISSLLVSGPTSTVLRGLAERSGVLV